MLARLLLIALFVLSASPASATGDLPRLPAAIAIEVPEPTVAVGPQTPREDQDPGCPIWPAHVRGPADASTRGADY